MKNSKEFVKELRQLFDTLYRVADRTTREYFAEDHSKEELLEYFIAEDGKRKKRVLRREQRLKALSVEEVDEIKKVFTLFDKDGSGTIDSVELKDAMRALGLFVKNKDEMKKLMEKADKDGSGTIEEVEFLSLMAE
jgi:hypothetical protein